MVTDSATEPQRKDIAWAVAAHGRRALAKLSANFYKKPAEKLAITGVTGTNGKTTTTYLIQSLLQHSGRKTAMVGTVEYHIAGRVIPAPHTTPESLELNRLFHEAVSLGVTEAVMEVSSHALAQERVYGVPYDVAVFTNLTRDHLDFHGTMENYFRAKAGLFQGCGTEPPRVAILNRDDSWSEQLREAGAEALRQGVHLRAGEWRLSCRKTRNDFDGDAFRYGDAGAPYCSVQSAAGKSERL